jgi:hypothetical protein
MFSLMLSTKLCLRCVVDDVPNDGHLPAPKENDDDDEDEEVEVLDVKRVDEAGTSSGLGSSKRRLCESLILKCLLLFMFSQML